MAGHWNYYTRMCAAATRALDKLYPGSLDPNGGSEKSVDILTSDLYLPSDIEHSQCHLIAPKEEIVKEVYEAQGDNDPGRFVEVFREATMQKDSFRTARVDVEREEMERESKEWRAGPESTKENVKWLGGKIIEDEDLVELLGPLKLKEMAKIAKTLSFHLHFNEKSEA